MHCFVALSVWKSCLPPGIPIARGGDVVQFFESHQHVSRFGAVRRPENARQLQLIDNARRATVSNTHPSLQQRRGSELILDANLRRLPEQWISLSCSLLRAPCSLFPVFLRFLECRDL